MHQMIFQCKMNLNCIKSYQVLNFGNLKLEYTPNGANFENIFVQIYELM